MTTLFLAMEGALLVVRRMPDGWASEQAMQSRSLQCLAAGPDTPKRVYAGTEDEGVWRSVDGGRTWSRAGTGLEGRDVTALAVAPSGRGNPGTVYAGTAPSTLFRSTDGGDSWTELEKMARLPSAPTWSFPPQPETHHVRWIGVDPFHAGSLYVAIEAGALVRSRDGGETWLDRVPSGPYDTHTLAAHPHLHGRLYSAAGDGYFESRDGGDSWTEFGRGLRHGYLSGLAVIPTDPETLLVSAASGPYRAYSARSAATFVYRRSGDGSWERVCDGLPESEGTTISSLATHRGEPDAVYAANNRGIFRSEDGGIRWQRLEILWPEEFLSESVQGFVAADLSNQ